MDNIAENSFPKGRLTKQSNIVKESIMWSVGVRPDDEMLPNKQHFDTTSSSVDDNKDRNSLHRLKNTYLECKPIMQSGCQNQNGGDEKTSCHTQFYKSSIAGFESGDTDYFNNDNNNEAKGAYKENTPRDYYNGSRDYYNHRYVIADRGGRKCGPYSRQDDFLRLYEHAYAAYKPKEKEQKNHL